MTTQASTRALEGLHPGARLPLEPIHALCTHCRSPLTRGDAGPFCCSGCEAVHELLAESGLSRYYTLLGERTLTPVGNLQTAHASPWREALVEELAAQPGQRHFMVDVQGLQCGACVWLIEALFRRQPGSMQIQVNPALGQLACAVQPGFPLESFLTSVESFGYRLGPEHKQASHEGDTLLLRTGVAVAIALNVMLLSAATYFGLHTGALFELVRTAGFVLATLSVLLGGSYFISRAYQGLRMGILHLDLPIALGIVLAYAGSAIAYFSGASQESYLDTLSVFIAVMLGGRVLQERLIEKNRKALLAADGSSGLLARRVCAGKTALVSCASVRTGDELLVCPGEFVPVRGTLETDDAECSLDWILGESEPKSFALGEVIPAGAVNAGKSALRVVALSDFTRSDLDALLSGEVRSIPRLAGDFWDRLARIYVALVLAATAGGALVWTLAGAGTASVLEVATAILVVTCPCAFGIATPLAYELAVAGLRRLGLFVRDGAFLERADRVRRIVFDKTGTLTTGVLEVANTDALAELSLEQQSAFYDLTAQSGHPKSAAVARALANLRPELSLGRTVVQEVAGRGVQCEREGVQYRFGDCNFALDQAGEASEQPVFSAHGVGLASLAYREVPRPDAERELAELRRAGYELWIASGDAQARVDLVAQRLDIPRARAFGGLSPEGKRELIARIDGQDTLMLGDGINDGLALSSAFCSGTPAIDRPFVPSRADFYYLSAGLAPIRSALRASKVVRRVVRHALVFASAYNVLAVALCVAGIMRPWLAAVMMPASSLVVIAYAVWSLSPRSSLWKSSIQTP